MNSRGLARIGLRVAIAATLAVSGVAHAQLYITGYRTIPNIGPMFLIQASVSLAVALLTLAGGPIAIQLAGAGAALGALGGFAASRTVGVFGFTERGFQPAPQALISVLAEIATVLLIAPIALNAATQVWQEHGHAARRAGRHTAPVARSGTRQ